MDSDVFHSYLPSGCQVVIEPMAIYSHSCFTTIPLMRLSVSSITSRRRAGATIFSCGYNKSTTAGMMQTGRMYFNLLFTEQRHRLDGFIDDDWKVAQTKGIARDQAVALIRQDVFHGRT